MGFPENGQDHDPMNHGIEYMDQNDQTNEIGQFGSADPNSLISTMTSTTSSMTSTMTAEFRTANDPNNTLSMGNLENLMQNATVDTNNGQGMDFLGLL